jgi:hypothetical protein
LTLLKQSPANDVRFAAASVVPVQQPTWMNLAYVIQWWLFAGMAVFGYGWLVHKEAQTNSVVAASSSRL